MRADRGLRVSGGASLRGSVEGDGPPLVLCHGGPGLWDYFDSFATGLRDDFTVHRWDQRGCGRSGHAPSYGLDVALQDVQDVKAAFGVHDAWIVVGHSWGAYLALMSALEHPESTSALVYISGTGTPSWWRDMGSGAYRAERARRMTTEDRRRLDELKAMERTKPEEVEFRRLSWITDYAAQGSPPESLEEMASSGLSINFEINRALSGAELYPEEQLVAACSRCEVPSLFIHGSEDPRPEEGARRLAGLMPAARFVRIDGAGHLPWAERPKETLAVMREFLDDFRPI